MIADPVYSGFTLNIIDDDYTEYDPDDEKPPVIDDGDINLMEDEYDALTDFLYKNGNLHNCLLGDQAKETSFSAFLFVKDGKHYAFTTEDFWQAGETYIGVYEKEIYKW